MIKKMGEGCRYGLMDPDMKDNGKIIELMDMEGWYTLRVIYMKEIGKMIKPMVKVLILKTREVNTKENGLTINKNMECKLIVYTTTYMFGVFVWQWIWRVIRC